MKIFDKAVSLNPGAHPLFHSDRGYQYTSKAFYEKLQTAKMRQSMSRVGRCIDNGPMESFWGMLKSEMYYLRRFTDRDELIQAIENYLYFYNHARFQKRLHCMTPMEFHYAYAGIRNSRPATKQGGNTQQNILFFLLST